MSRQYGDIWVEGEISNCRPAPSGHLYFTLKDADAQLPVVLFRRQALLLRFRPEDGLHVLVRGRVSVYAQRGQLQLVGETIEPVGAGSLQLAFEQLKERLKAEGLFDAARKRPLPAFPRSVGIVTSPTGAVIRDFLNIVGRRHAGLSVVLCPAAVQGEQAAGEVEAALFQLNASGLVDVIVIARGGGSLEDLSAFNSERVARAIVASNLPVVSAIGHETDFTIADFVADLRAPTPSAAAELITEAQHRVAERVEVLSNATGARGTVSAAACAAIAGQRSAGSRGKARDSDAVPGQPAAGRSRVSAWRKRERVDTRVERERWRILRPTCLHHEPRQMLARTRERLAAGATSAGTFAGENSAKVGGPGEALDARLRSLSPLAVLERGYALVLDSDGAVIRSVTR